MRSVRRSRVAVLTVAGLLLPLLRAWERGAQAAPRPSAGLPAAEGGGALREEFFVLEQLPEAGPGDALAAAGEGASEVGLVRCRRLLLEQGQQLELDVLLPEQGTRVLHIERRSGGETTLVWREFRAGSGRTLSGAWRGDGRVLALREWGERQPRQVELEVGEGGILPLRLLERLRAGDVGEGAFQVFDPLSRSFERLRLRVTPLPGDELTAASEERRRAELVRQDGTLAGAWVLEGEQLSAFQWQGGSLRARRIPPEDYEQRLASEPLGG